MQEQAPPGSLRIAYLVYRGNPRCGGQGVYTRHLTRELQSLGHSVTVFSGPPYPELDEGVELVKVASLDLYRDPDPFRVPRLREFNSSVDVLEFALMCTAGFPEPLTFSLRARRLLAGRLGEFDLVHDNQSLGIGHARHDGRRLAGARDDPPSRSPSTASSSSPTPKGWRRRLTLRRWYGFVGMQARVARQVPRIVTVSESSRRDIAEQLGVELERIAVVPVGVDDSVFRPMPGAVRVPGRIMTTASSDVPMKGLIPLAGGAREGSDRAPGRPSRGHRPVEGRERGSRCSGTFRAQRTQSASCRV